MTPLKTARRRVLESSACAAASMTTPRKPEIDMPWTVDRYPASMRRLPPWVRNKAIEIANALLDEGMDEGKAIRIGIAKAKEWAARRIG